MRSKLNWPAELRELNAAIFETLKIHSHFEVVAAPQPCDVILAMPSVLGKQVLAAPPRPVTSSAPKRGNCQARPGCVLLNEDLGKLLVRDCVLE